MRRDGGGYKTAGYETAGRLGHGRCGRRSETAGCRGAGRGGAGRRCGAGRRDSPPTAGTSRHAETRCPGTPRHFRRTCPGTLRRGVPVRSDAVQARPAPRAHASTLWRSRTHEARTARPNRAHTHARTPAALYFRGQNRPGPSRWNRLGEMNAHAHPLFLSVSAGIVSDAPLPAGGGALRRRRPRRRSRVYAPPPNPHA
jgi:hypothetical protein